MADTSFSEIISSLTGAMNSLKTTSKEMLTTLRSYASEIRNLSGAGGGSAPTPGSPSTAPGVPRFSSYQDRQGFGQLLKNVAGGALAGAGAIAFALPTTQEAVDVQAIASRMNFYGGGAGYSSVKNRVGAYPTNDASYLAMLNASYMGTALSPMDAPMAVNAASSAGLLPGLSNFGAGAGFKGIMGGAALASNLTPGLGLAGGVNVMAGLQNPRTINMARMFGIQMRNSENSQAVDLPSIIDQLFNILSRSAPVTKENIAISAMPGNALDSILNQYFGMDPQLRGVIIAGLIQKASGASLDKPGLLKTGGLTAGVQSTGNRASSEQNLIQQFSGQTVGTLVGSNNILQSVYGKLVDEKNTGLVKYIQRFSTALDTLGGARGGAGQLAIDAMTNALEAGTTVLSYGGLVGKVAGLVGGAFGAYKSVGALEKLSSASPNSPFSLTGQTGVPSTPGGQTFTGAITINVSGGVDQYNIASAITQALSQAV